MERMTKKDWGFLDHFSLEERDQQGRPAFPLPYAMNRGLMYRLDAMRKVVGASFIIHESTGGEHTSELHGLGLGIDGHFVGLGAIEQYLFAEQWNWPGLGFSPYWHDPGIHVDMRALGPYEKAARWWRDAEGHYHPIVPGVVMRRWA